MRTVDPLWSPTRLPFALGVAAVAALWVAFSGMLGESHADSLVPALVSLLGWTPMYWGQDRFGMLVPLLTLPFDSPFVVVTGQLALSAFGCFAAFMLISRWVMPNAAGTLGGAGAAVLLLTLVPAGIRHEMLSPSQPYGVSLALLFGALTLSRGAPSPRSWWIAGVMAAASFWVTIGSVLVAVPVLGLHAGLETLERWRAGALSGWRERLRPWAPMIGAGVLAGAVAVFARSVAPRTTTVRPFPISEYTTQWGLWLERMSVATEPHHWPRAVLLLALLVGAWCLLPAGRRLLSPGLRPAMILISVAVLYWLFFGRMRWIAMNDYNFRYAIPSAMLIQGAVLALAFGPTLALPRWPQRVTALAAASGVIVACVAVLGTPSVARARQALDVHGAHTEALLALRATHFAGDYWVVWPGVLHAHLVAYERGQPLWLYGISDRAVATRRRWIAPPEGEWRIAAVKGDAQLQRWLEYGKVGPVERVSEGPALELYRPVTRSQ